MPAERAHALRSTPSPAESRLWEAIRAGKLGLAVKRQVVVGKYVADFVVPARSLIIEVDGRHRERRRAADARRDRKLAQLGFRLLRIDAEVVHHAP